MSEQTRTPKSIFGLEGEWMRLLEWTRLGYDPETGEDSGPEAIDDAFALLEGDVESKLAGCGFVAMRLKKDAAVVAEEAKRLKSKKDLIDSGRERLEERMRELMILTETSKVKKPSISVTLSKVSLNTVQVFDPKKVPEEFMTKPKPHVPEPSVADIKSALKAKKDVPGAKLVESKRSLTIK